MLAWFAALSIFQRIAGVILLLIAVGYALIVYNQIHTRNEIRETKTLVRQVVEAGICVDIPFDTCMERIRKGIPTGPRGAQGPSGNIGPRGFMGEQGQTGDRGRGPTLRELVFALSVYCDRVSCRGPSGRTPTQADIARAVASFCATRSNCSGPQGAQGPKGDKGDEGSPGNSGMPGSPVQPAPPAPPKKPCKPRPHKTCP